LGPALQEIPLNVVLATIIVVLGLLAIFISPILPLLMLGAVAFFLSFDRKATTRFVMMGGALNRLWSINDGWFAFLSNNVHKT